MYVLLFHNMFLKYETLLYMLYVSKLVVGLNMEH